MAYDMDTVYVLLEKDAKTDFVTVTGVYEDYDHAQEVMEECMATYGEAVGYKIVTRTVAPKPKKVKVDALDGVNRFHPESPAHLVLLLKRRVITLADARTIADGWGYKFRGRVANSHEGFSGLLEQAMKSMGRTMDQVWVEKNG